MRRISIKGVFIGGIVDIVATNVLVLLVYFGFVASGSPSGTNAHGMPELLTSGPGLLAAQIAGAGASVFGGYIAARLAKHDELLNGALSAYLCVSFAIVGIATGGRHDRLMLELLMLPLSPCLGLLGGYLRLAQRRRTTQLSV